MAIPPGWIVFPDNSGQFWEINTAMLIALVRAQVRAEYPPRRADYNRLWSDVVLGGGPHLQVAQYGYSLPVDMASLVENKVDGWFRANRNHVLNAPDHFATNLLPDMCTQALRANVEIQPKLADFSADIVDHLRTFNRNAPDGPDKAKAEAMLVELAKIAVITGVMVLPVGWAVAGVAAGAVVFGGYKYAKTGSAGDALVEGMSFAASAAPGMKQASTGLRLFAAGGGGVLSGVKKFSDTGNVGAAVVSGAGEVVVGLIGVGHKDFTKSMFAAVRAGEVSAAQARGAIVVLSGFKTGTELGTGTLNGLVEGKGFTESFTGATLSVLAGAGADHAGGIAKKLATPVASRTVLAAAMGVQPKLFKAEFASKLTTDSAKAAGDLLNTQLSELIFRKQAPSAINFAAEELNQSLHPREYVRRFVLRRAP